jgi:hypothetical protein
VDSRSGHHQRIHDERGIPFRIDGPANDSPEEKADNDCDMGPAFSGPHVRESGLPPPVPLIGLAFPVKDVVGNHRPFADVLRLTSAFGPCPLGIDPHQSFDPAKAAGQPADDPGGQG